MTEAIVEIRDYTIEAASFDADKQWAEELAAPWLKANLDVIDFWMDCGIDAEVGGSDPYVSPNGQPNVTWKTIRWNTFIVSVISTPVSFRKYTVQSVSNPVRFDIVTRC